MPRMPIPQDWNGQDWTCFAVEWPDSPMFRAILLGQVSELTRGRYWDERSGSVLAAQDIGTQIYLRNQEQDECLLACTDEALAALNLIAANIAAIECSGGTGGGPPGSGGAGFTEAPPIDTGIDHWNETTDPPEGFDTWADYEAYKCAVAQRIFDNAIIDLNWMGTWTSLGAGIASMSAGYISRIPGAHIAALGVLLGSLTLSAFSQIVTDVKNALQAKEEELVCALFSQITASGAGNAWKQIANAEIEAQITLVGTTTIAHNLSDGFASNDNLNSLFFDDGAYSDIIPNAVPCTACTAPCLDVLLSPPVAEDGFSIQINPNGGWSLSQSSGGLAWATSVEFGSTSTLNFEPALTQEGGEAITLEMYQSIAPGNAYDLQWRFFDGVGTPIDAWSAITPPWLENLTINITAPSQPWASILFRSERKQPGAVNSELVFLEVSILCQ